MKISVRQKTRSSLPVVCGALLAALTAVPSAHAQTPVTTWAQSYGVGSYDGNGQPLTADNYGSGNDRAIDIVAMPDGGMVVAGYIDLPELYLGTNYSSAYGCPALVRYAADGHIVWQYTLRQDNDAPPDPHSNYRHAQIYQMLADAQSNLYVTMTKDRGNDGAAIPQTVAKFSPAGALLWQVSYDGDLFVDDNGKNPTASGAGAFASMSLTADGGVVICGLEGGGNGSGYPFFAKINADGSLGTHRPFVSQGQYVGAGAAAQSADGTHFLVAMGFNGNATPVVLTDASGNFVAERSFNDPEVPVRVLANTDGTYTLLTNGLYVAPGSTSGVAGARVRLLNVDLSTVWETVITNVNVVPFVGRSNINNLTRTSDGGYLLTSFNDGSAATGKMANSSAFDALVLRLDADGNLASSFALGGPDNEGSYDVSGRPTSFANVVQTTDGGFGVAVTSYSYHLDDSLPHDIQRPDWWTVKTTPTGRVHNFKGVLGAVPTKFFPTYSNTAPSVSSTYYTGVPSHWNGQGAFVQNAEPAFVIQDLGAKTGINDPTRIFQAEPATVDIHPPFFSGEAVLGSGVYYLSFPSGKYFGYYSYLDDPNFVYHYDLGYEYVFDAKDAGAGVYLYDYTSGGFFYSSPIFPFPYLYDFSLNSVVYYYPDPNNPGRYNTDGYRFFYVFNTGQIISK